MAQRELEHAVTFVTGTKDSQPLIWGQSLEEISIMSFWTAIAIICVAGIIGQVFRSRHEAGNSSGNQERLDQMMDRIDALEREMRERIEVLERIMTDRKDDLKRAFDGLE